MRGEGYREKEGLKSGGQSETQWKRNKLIERCVHRHTKPLHMHIQEGNTCVGRLVASSGPTTLSFVLAVNFKERVQGIGLAVGRVNAQQSHKLFRTHLFLVFV